MAQYPVAEIGNPKVGDVVRMKVESIEDGIATLALAEAEETLEPKPSTINKMAEAFTAEEAE